MSTMQQCGRVRWIDIAKGIGIALVTFVHIPNGDGESVWLPAIAGGVAAVGLFHMPLFFLLSGFTFNAKGGAKSFALRKAKALLAPYCFYSLYTLAKPIATLLVPSLSGAVGSTRDYSIAGSLFDVFIAGNGLWFLMALFVGEMVVYSVERILAAKKLGDASRKRFRLVLGLILVVTSQLRSAFVPLPFDPFQFFAGLRAAGFMLVGLAIKEGIFSAADRSLSHALVAFAALVLSIVTLGNNEFLDVVLEVLAAFAGALMVIFFSQAIGNSKPLEYVGRNSLTYYAVNALTMNVVKLFVFRLLSVDASVLSTAAQYLFALCLIIVAFVALALESEIIKRFLWWSIGKPRPIRDSEKQHKARY